MAASPAQPAVGMTGRVRPQEAGSKQAPDLVDAHIVSIFALRPTSPGKARSAPNGGSRVLPPRTYGDQAHCVTFTSLGGVRLTGGGRRPIQVRRLWRRA